MVRLADLDPLPVVLWLARAVERAEGHPPGTPEAATAAPLRFVFMSLSLFWGLDDDVSRLRREPALADTVPALERRREKARKLAEVVLAKWGDLVAAELHADRGPSSVPAAALAV